ncbi:MAG: DUF2141 domain-containing protein [Halothiobacillus sp.]|jgi:uncharacterized protein (DUF2141 family)|nr:DUF2141 domain-containing protein [Halothiobacillus sp.]
MSELPNRKPTIASTIGRTPRSVPIPVRYVILFVVLLTITIPGLSYGDTPDCHGIHIKIKDIKNSEGTIACALFESVEGFPTEFMLYATNIMIIKIRDSQARCDFLDIPPGTYALASIHDKNMDGELNYDWVGRPKEGYGFSNDAEGRGGPPSFEAASFEYDGRTLNLTISLNY